MSDDRRMSTDRFYGGTSDRLRHLRAFLTFVDTAHPSRRVAYDWLAENTPGDSDAFAERNIDFLITTQILAEVNGEIHPGTAGKEYLRSRDPVALYDGLTTGVKGFETILQSLTNGPMVDEEIAACLRSAFPDYEVPVAVAERHREWLEVLGFLYRADGHSHITAQGEAVLSHSSSEPHSQTHSTAGRQHTTESQQVAVSQNFRDLVLNQYNGQCLLTDISHSALVTIAHVLPRSDYIEYAEDPSNAFVLNWTHHMAFDAGLFTFDTDHRLHVNPKFTPQDSWLQQTLVKQDERPINLPNEAYIAPSHLDDRNELLDWWPPS